MKKLFVLLTLCTSVGWASDVKDVAWTCSNQDGLKAELVAKLDLAPQSRVSLEETVLTYQVSDVKSVTETFSENTIFDNREDVALSIEKEFGAAYGKVILGYLNNGTPYPKATMLFSTARNSLIVYDYETQEEYSFESCKRVK